MPTCSPTPTSGAGGHTALRCSRGALGRLAARRNDQPYGLGATPEAFEDVYAPDAFGVQLLGPGYAGRVPERPVWHQQPAGSAAVLLQHVDLPAWFDAPFVPYWTAEQAPPPTLLARARVQIAPILYSPGVLSGNGYADEGEL